MILNAGHESQDSAAVASASALCEAQSQMPFVGKKTTLIALFESCKPFMCSAQ